MSLANKRRATLINERLFIPQRWTENKIRCQKAGIPKEDIQFKTKPQLALEMVKQAINEEIKFDRIGGDGLYGHNRAVLRTRIRLL